MTLIEETREPLGMAIYMYIYMYIQYILGGREEFPEILELSLYRSSWNCLCESIVLCFCCGIT